MRVILTGFMILAMVGAAQAAVTLVAVEQTITAAAKADDSALDPNTRCWDVQATSSQDLVGFIITAVVADGGGMYQNVNGAVGDLGPPSALAIQFVPASEFDSYVNMPKSPPLGLLGNLDNLPFEYGDLTIPADGALHGPQTGFVVARITLLDPLGTGTLYITSAEAVPGSDLPDLVEHVVPLPEPATMSLLALGGLAALRRRR